MPATGSPASAPLRRPQGVQEADFQTQLSDPASTLATPLAEPYFDVLTVVSLDRHGQPRSLYGYRVWDLGSMGTDGGQTPCYLHFFEARPLSVSPDTDKPVLAALVREQVKALLWLHIEAGRPRALNTIVQSTKTLNRLARGAYDRGVSLFDLLCDPQILCEVSAALNSGYAKCANALLKTLWRHRVFLKIDLEVRLKQLSEAIRQSAPSGSAEGNQTPIIPSRIYCAILAALLNGLDEIELNLEALLTAYMQERSTSLNAPKELRFHQVQYRRERELSALREAFRARGWTRGSLREFIAGEISRVQLRLMSLVMAFTGMRIGEAQILPLKGVLEEVVHRGSVHHVVHGFSHKLNGGVKKPATWVISREGHRAILLAKRIASTFLQMHSDDNPAAEDGALLFSTKANPYKKIPVESLYEYLDADLIPVICPTITQADIDELNKMELERGWQREGIEVGKPWPLTFHQYRRSLSVYAHRSGMVSLPALKGQLQHITDEMCVYYSDGFCRAVNLVFDKTHFSHEWSAAKAESSFLAYTMGILFSDEELFGRGADRMADAVTDRTRSETLQLFKDGRLAYKETVLGGCVSTEECRARPLEAIEFECLDKDCVNLVVSPRRLALVIRSQETVVAALGHDESGSVEHRLELGNLQILLKARQRLIGPA